MTPEPAHARVELLGNRVLDGPNLYFTRQAIKTTLDLGAWCAAPEETVSAAFRALDSRRPKIGEPGGPVPLS